MSDLVPARPVGGGLARREPSLGAIEQRRLDRELQRQLVGVEHEMVLAIRRENAIAQVTQTALFNTAMLSGSEEHLSQVSPLAAPRLQAIVDAYAAGACTRVMRYGS